MKLYIVSYGETGTETGEGCYSLVAENGELLYSHFCSNFTFAKGDLLLNRPNRIEECKNKYGNYELLFLGEDNMTQDELVKRNKEFYKESEEK